MSVTKCPDFTDLPHSWSVTTWPKEVFPNDTDRGRWIVRAYRRELMAEGALARAGKSLIVIGRGYGRWLAKRAAHVPGYVSNNPRMRSSNADVSLWATQKNADEADGPSVGVEVSA